MLPIAVLLCLAGGAEAIHRQDWPAVAGWLAAAAGLGGLWTFLLRIEDLIARLTFRGGAYPPSPARPRRGRGIATILPFRRPPA